MVVIIVHELNDNSVNESTNHKLYIDNIEDFWSFGATLIIIFWASGINVPNWIDMRMNQINAI